MSEAILRGDVVVDPNDPSRTAVVVDGPQSVAGTQYWEVLTQDQERLLFAVRDLKKKDVRRESPVAWLTARALSDPDSLARFITHLRLSRGLTNLYYSFSSTRTLFRVHQFKPVMKAIESSVPRLLLADEVGLGKTIEAGLVWAELDARAPTRRVLVLCPSNLRDKWALEMQRRFDREMTIADRATFLRFADQYFERGDRTRFFAVSSFGQLRNDDVLQRLSEQPPTFDLVIVDEAHAMRNPSTKTHQLGELLAQNTSAMLLLSATPVNLGEMDLFNLLTLLRPDEFDQPGIFNYLMEPNGYVNEAARILRSEFPPPTDKVLDMLRGVERSAVAHRFTSDAVYRDVVNRLETASDLGRRDVAELQAEIQNLNTLSHVYTRTRKRDLRDHVTVRRAEHLPIELSADELAVYTAALRYVTGVKRRTSGTAAGLAAVMPARQAASCLPVMSSYLERVLRDHRITADLAEGEEIDDTTESGQTALAIREDETVALRDVLEACERLRGVDSKFDALAHRFSVMRQQGTRKYLVFSFFRLTIAYLEERLTELGFRCRQMTGATPMKARPGILDEFRNGDLEVLICSEIGSEGLDFEFCDVVVNYDLPWNPMRLEQRIGRIDRFGQQSPAVRIINFEIPGTIDTDIFYRLYERIGIFERSIGELEPILGETFHRLQSEIAASDLTPEEQQRIADQIALAVEREKRQQEEFDQVRDQLIGADAFVEDALEDARDAHRYITAEELRRYVHGFLRKEASPASLVPPSPVTGVEAIAGSPALADHLRTAGREFATPDFLDLVTRLETGSAVPVTFDPDTAYRHQCEFLTVRHPVVQSMVRHNGEIEPFHPGGYVRIEGSDRVGEWIFFVFLLTAGGLQPRRELFTVAFEPATGITDEDVGQELMTFLTGDGPTPMSERDIPVIDPTVAEAAYGSVLHSVDAARTRLEDDLGRRNAALLSARQASLRQGLEVQRVRLTEMANRADLDERIRRMRLAQISNLEQRTQMEVERLEGQRGVSVGFQVLAGGLAEFR